MQRANRKRGKRELAKDHSKSTCDDSTSSLPVLARDEKLDRGRDKVIQTEQGAPLPIKDQKCLSDP